MNVNDSNKFSFFNLIRHKRVACVVITTIMLIHMVAYVSKTESSDQHSTMSVYSIGNDKTKTKLIDDLKLFLVFLRFICF